MRSARQPVMSRPANVTRPPSGGTPPLMQAKAVVLPSPFGPMSAVMVPGRTSKSSPRRAWTP